MLECELLAEPLAVEEFPGYNDVYITHKKLQILVTNQTHSWRAALSIVKGVYAIGDSVDKRVYVGSATGATGIWQRWESYALVPARGRAPRRGV